MSLDSVFGLVQTALELGLISSLTVLALFLSYSMLGVCDLSTDGCFTLGATVGAAVAIAGHPYLSIPAAMLCGIGGIIGILIGTGGSLLVGRLMFQMTIYPAAWITLCAFTLSVALGILFGIYPAAKAARLQPVEALRAE